MWLRMPRARTIVNQLVDDRPSILAGVLHDQVAQEALGRLFVAALVVELFSMFIHTRDGWTAVVPAGMTLSILGVLLALCAVGTLFRVPVTWVTYREVAYREALS